MQNIKPIVSVKFHQRCNPQIFMKDNDVWVKHTDYFSQMWRPPKNERTDMSTNYYCKKYFGKAKREKFCYADMWGSIILRNEAWIKICNLVPLCKHLEINCLQIAQKIIDSQDCVVEMCDGTKETINS